MCKVKSGALILNVEDVRNMVIGIILRQQTKYNRDNIFKLTINYLQGSNLLLSNDLLMNIIDRCLDILIRNGEIRCVSGIYFASDI